MRVLVHDYAGHPYAVQLSRALGRRGIEVAHVYCASNPMPKGSLAKQPKDPESLQIVPVTLDAKIDKAKFLKRRSQEIEHGRKVAAIAREFKPDVLISGSAALDTQKLLWEACLASNVAPVFWLQDLTGVATDLVLRKKLPAVGGPIGSYYIKMEERLLRQSAAIVAISGDFVPALRDFGVDERRIFVIENWGPIDEVPVLAKQNPWSVRFGLNHTFNFIYSGTLGMKHDPSILARLAEAFRGEPAVRIVVLTEGIGRKWLEQEKLEKDLGNLVLLDFQSFSEVPQVMAAADVLTAILEPSAGVFSVPSKVLSYLCSQRPLLLAVPPENLASKIVAAADAGLVSSPFDGESYVENARTLFRDAGLRERLGNHGRTYAENTFDIEAVADKFLEVFESCLSRSPKP